MSRIQPTFARLAHERRKALIPYITAGFPFPDVTPALMHAMVEAGSDVIDRGSYRALLAGGPLPAGISSAFERGMHALAIEAAAPGEASRW